VRFNACRLPNSATIPNSAVIPAKAGIQGDGALSCLALDTRLRGDDD